MTVFIGYAIIYLALTVFLSLIFFFSDAGYEDYMTYFLAAAIIVAIVSLFGIILTFGLNLISGQPIL